MDLKSFLALLFFANSVYTLPICINGVGTKPNPGTLIPQRGEPIGKTFCFNVIGAATGKLYGTDYYTDDTVLAVAAVHRGLVSVGQEKAVKVTLRAGQASYTASTRYGLTSSSWTAWDWTYTVDSLCTTPTCISCNAGYYLQTGDCLACHPTCATCSGPANTQCTTCKSGLIRQPDTTCSCNTGYYLVVASCSPCHPTCTTCSGPANNQCLTCITGMVRYPDSTCSCNTGYYLQGLNCLPCDSTCASCSGPVNNQCLTCNTGRFLYYNSTCLTNCSSVLQSIKNFAPYCEFSCSGSTPYMFSNRTCTQCPAPSYVFADGLNQVCIYKEVSPPAKLITELSVIAGQIGAAAIIGTFFTNSEGSQGLSVSVLARLLEYIKYINVSHSEPLEEVLQAQTELFQLSPDFPEDLMERMPLYELPEVFSKYDVISSFIINCWEDFFMISVLSVLCLLLFAVEWVSAKRSKWRVSIRKLKIMIRNILLSTVYSTFGDIIFFSTLEFSTAEKVANWTILSFTAAVAFIFICFVIFILHTWLLLKHSTKNTQQTSRRKHKYLQIFFDDFKDKSILQRGFLLWMIIRDVIFSIILTVLFEHPLIQASITVLLNIAMLILLISSRPFKERIQCVQLVLSELDLLVINSSILALAISDRFAPGNIDLIELAGQIIIYLSIAFSLISCIFLLINVTYSVWEFWKTRKLKQKSAINNISLKPRNISAADTDQSIKLDSSQIMSLNQTSSDSHATLHDHEKFSLSVHSPHGRRKINKSRGNLPKSVSNSPVHHSNRQTNNSYNTATKNRTNQLKPPNQSSRNKNLKSEERYRQKENEERYGQMQRRNAQEVSRKRKRQI